MYSIFSVHFFTDAIVCLCASALFSIIFLGPFTFTYNRGHGECRNPVSNIESCTEDSRLLLNLQACPDVAGTESTGSFNDALFQSCVFFYLFFISKSKFKFIDDHRLFASKISKSYAQIVYALFTVEELTCLATWKDGNSRYLVGLVSHHHAVSNEERYRCFVYEKILSNGKVSEVVVCDPIASVNNTIK